MIYGAFNRNGDFKCDFTITDLAFALGHNVTLVNRTVIFDGIPTVTIEESYNNEQVSAQKEEIVRMLLSVLDYHIYELIDLNSQLLFN